MKLPFRLLGISKGNHADTQVPLLNYSQTDHDLKCVYTLTDELLKNADQAEKARKLTLDRSRPSMGLKGTYGLFASKEWWRSVNSRRMPLRFVTGIITRAYEAGQDHTGLANTIELRTPNAQTIEAGIYTNEPRDSDLFREGRYVELVYALDPLKSGGASKVALEMAISV